MNIESFYNVLFTTLLANCPVDTRNMQTHITIEDLGDYFEIVISGPSKHGDYAKYVNEQPTIVKSGPNKGKLNYQWVERTLEQVANVYGEVSYEIS